MRSVPVILQTEATECGLACLAMVARYHGHDIDLNILRKRHLVSLKGASLKSIISIAANLELGARPLRLDLEHLNELTLPAILHWDFNHYVVMTKVGHDKVHIIDPGIGRRTLSMKLFSESFTGVALELTPKAEFKPINARLKPQISSLWSKLVGLKRAIAQTFILTLILQIILLISPFFLQLIVDGVLPSGDVGLLIALGIGFGGLAILRACTEALRSWAVLVFGNQMSLQMVGNIFSHLIRLPTSYFEKRHVGDLISRMGSVEPIQKALTQTVVTVIIDGIMALLMLGVMFIYSPILAFIVLASVTLLSLITLFIYPRLRETQEDVIFKRALENTHTIETIRANTTLKLFGREAEREAAWRNLYMDVINSNITHGKFLIWQKFAETFLTGAQLVIIAYIGARLIMDGSSGFTIGMLFAFLAYRADFTFSVTQLLQKGIEFSLLSLHLDRLSDIIYAKSETSDKAEYEHRNKYLPSNLKGEITVEDLWFRYADDDPWIIQGLSVTFPAGEMTTLTGLSGGGKTTLLKLIMGLYPPNKGRILIDGIPLSELRLQDWRGVIGVVMQDDQLLSGTISENISLFEPKADMERIISAATAAKVHDDIAAIPMGYDSMVGNMGSVLSGGQKQRVLLARALYHEPKILFLDEGTANLDSETEKQVVNVIKNMPITRIIVAHRPAFINTAAKVIKI
ncbi:MAG: peptidase domain-containing ABC transporter [Maricaulaceae bacterium]